MTYPIVLLPDTPTVPKSSTLLMKTKSPSVILVRVPKPTKGTVKLYLLPKAVADFNKTHGKTYVV